MRPAPGDGLHALPMPQGEPSSIWSAAATLRAAASAVEVAPLAASGGRLPVLAEWSGEAATAAAGELTLVAAREAAMVDRLTRAATVLSGYADELDAAQRSAATLQASWDRVLPSDPLPPLPEAALAAVAGTYGAMSADLQLAADVAAHRLRALVAEVVAVDRPGRRGLATLGWADPAPSVAAVRGAMLAGLPVVSGAVGRREAGDLAEQTVADLAAVADGDVGAVGRVVNRFGSHGWDPVAAQSLWSRLDPTTVGRALDSLARSGDGDGFGRLLTALGVAMATVANPAYAVGLDAVTRARLDAWRGPWLVAMAAAVASPPPGAVGGPVGGAWVQGRLLTAVRQSGLSPGPRYASTVAVAVVAADRAWAASGFRPAGSTVRAWASRRRPRRRPRPRPRERPRGGPGLAARAAARRRPPVGGGAARRGAVPVDRPRHRGGVADRHRATGHVRGWGSSPPRGRDARRGLSRSRRVGGPIERCGGHLPSGAGSGPG